MHLLLADDDRDSVETLADLIAMSSSSIHVTIVFDGIELLEAATNTETLPDVIITDIEMPRMNGITAAVKVRTALGAATPLLIAVTGHMGVSKLAEIKGLFDHVLLKPFKIHDLLCLIPGLENVRLGNTVSCV